MKKLVFLIVLMTGITYMSSAQSTPRVSKKQINQQIRIAEGTQSGDLTKREATQLQNQQLRIQNSKEIAKSDGVVTRKERAVIRKQQMHASRNIARKKQNLR